jgi:hypothetical protein
MEGLHSTTVPVGRRVCQRDPQFCSQYKNLPVVPLDVPGGHVKGRPDAPVTIVEFSDFECGHCKLAYEGLKQALPIYGDQVQVRFHHYPLDGACNAAMPPGGGHKYACLAAMAAECADAQGKFWQYHDNALRASAGVSRARISCATPPISASTAITFVACLDSDAPRAAIRQDVASGTKLGIDSTPTLYSTVAPCGRAARRYVRLRDRARARRRAEARRLTRTNARDGARTRGAMRDHARVRACASARRAVRASARQRVDACASCACALCATACARGGVRVDACRRASRVSLVRVGVDACVICATPRARNVASTRDRAYD